MICAPGKSSAASARGILLHWVVLSSKPVLWIWSAMIVPPFSARCFGSPTSSKEIEENKRERCGWQREVKRSRVSRRLTTGTFELVERFLAFSENRKTPSTAPAENDGVPPPAAAPACQKSGAEHHS